MVAAPEPRTSAPSPAASFMYYVFVSGRAEVSGWTAELRWLAGLNTNSNPEID